MAAVRARRLIRGNAVLLGRASVASLDLVLLAGLANRGGVGVVTGPVVRRAAEVGRGGVLGQSVVVSVGGVSLAAAPEAAEEASLLRLRAVAGGVVVLGGGSKALLLAVVTDQGEFY